MPTDTQPEPDYVIAARELEAATARILREHGLTDAFGPVTIGAKDADGWEHDLHTLTLLPARSPKVRRKPAVFQYRTGIVHRRNKAHPGVRPCMIIPPKVTAAQVLGSVAQDCRGPYVDRQSFEDWCSEYGYDTDSRKAEATFRACREGGERLASIGLSVEEIAELADLAGRL